MAQASITWWLPGGFTIVYIGSPKSRRCWMRLTWRGYLAAWVLIVRASWLLRGAR
jgi:hypothetical protein